MIPEPNFVEGRSGFSRMTPGEISKLIELIPNVGHVIEIGSADGVSVSILAEARPGIRFLSIDPYYFDPGNPGDNWNNAPTRLINWRRNSRPNQCLWLGQLETIHQVVNGTKFDLIIVDGDHSFVPVYRDLVLSASLLRINGVIAVHDYHESPSWPQVKEATDKFLRDNITYAEFDRQDSLSLIHKVRR